MANTVDIAAGVSGGNQLCKEHASILILKERKEH